MPELPEVEILVRHLAPLLRGRTIRDVSVRRERIVAPGNGHGLARALRGATIQDIRRRGKHLLFELKSAHGPVTAVGHLGMTGRMYVAPPDFPLPKHAALVFELDRGRFVFEDTRYFGRFVLGGALPPGLGPEPLESAFTPEYFARELKRSGQAIKVKLLDQELVAGVGNIYASEALFRAGISPLLAARKLTRRQVERLWRSIRETLADAIECGSTVPIDFVSGRDGLFYFGSRAEAPKTESNSSGRWAGEGLVEASDARKVHGYEERLRVYDRAGQPCVTCGTPIRRIAQAARSTYFCPHCQRQKK